METFDRNGYRKPSNSHYKLQETEERSPEIRKLLCLFSETPDIRVESTSRHPAHPKSILKFRIKDHLHATSLNHIYASLPNCFIARSRRGVHLAQANSSPPESVIYESRYAYILHKFGHIPLSTIRSPLIHNADLPDTHTFRGLVYEVPIYQDD
ncbi:hypothetical protein M758_9G184600 [Ceratodon purpureus]|nr:hypothetical protein M758_9G184600 [Ceratodon purpureus]